MDAVELVEGLTRFAGRGAGTDSERRAATWLAERLRADGHQVAVEPFWCRPNWAMAHAWHAAAGVAGSLISLASPAAGVAILSIALVSVWADWLTGRSLGRRLTPERASQNVVAAVSAPPLEPAAEPVHLILTANYDAGRTGAAYRHWLRRPPALVRRGLGGLTPGWLGWLSLALAWLLALACLRWAGPARQAIGAAQLPPSAALLVAFALLVELGWGEWSPGSGDNGTGVAVAVAVATALKALPPENVGIELVLSGAGDGPQLGLRHHLARRAAGARGARRAARLRGARRAARLRASDERRADTIVVGIAPCAAGSVRWWESDGPLIPLRSARPLRTLARQTSADEPHLGARPHRGRGSTPAAPARMAGLPAISFGCLDDSGLCPRSHQVADTADAIEPSAADVAAQFGLLLVDAIDAAVAEQPSARAATPA